MGKRRGLVSVLLGAVVVGVPAGAADAPLAQIGRAAVPPGMSPSISAGLREIGAKIEGPKTTALYAPLHAAIDHSATVVLEDVSYGPHERHRLDVFQPAATGTNRPLIVFVHGGGFARGAKSTPDSFYYDNIGYWAASEGLVGVTLNYRLSPEFQYPSGADDVARAVAWLRSHAKDYGADPRRIVLWGHSAGAAHVADYLVRTAKPQVAGAVLTSGIYTPTAVWKSYYGDDESRYAQLASQQRLAAVDTPLLVVSAELDPPDFLPDTERLIAQRGANGKPLRSVKLANHSHLSEAYAVGTSDESLSVPVLEFVRSLTP